MMGVWSPWSRSRATISGTAWAATSLLTVTRTNSLPASARARTWATVDSTSAVSVLVMDWTTTGWTPPTITPPTSTPTVRLRLTISSVFLRHLKFVLEFNIPPGLIWQRSRQRGSRLNFQCRSLRRRSPGRSHRRCRSPGRFHRRCRSPGRFRRRCRRRCRSHRSRRSRRRPPRRPHTPPSLNFSRR